MKIPRWLLLTLITLSVLGVVLPAGWWWFTWPARTIRDFTALLEEGRFDDADQFLKRPARLGVLRIDGQDKESVVFDADSSKAMTRFSAPPSWPSEMFRTWCTLDNLQTDSRSFSDWILGRQEFSYHRTFTTPIFIGGYAERGTVVFRCEPWAAPAF